MTTFVLTGAAPDYAGQKIFRSTLELMIRSAGHSVAGYVGSRNDILVASRSDTVKARSARSIGAQVITYEQFYEILACSGANINVPVQSSPGYVDYQNGSVGRRATPRPRAKLGQERAIWFEPSEEPPMPEATYDRSTRALQL